MKLPAAIFVKERQCPCCQQGTVRTAELSKKAQCYYCKRLIEVNLFYTILTAVAFTATILGLVYLDMKILAGFVLFCLVIFNALLNQITTSYFPLKSYHKD